MIFIFKKIEAIMKEYSKSRNCKKDILSFLFIFYVVTGHQISQKSYRYMRAMIAG